VATSAPANAATGSRRESLTVDPQPALVLRALTSLISWCHPELSRASGPMRDLTKRVTQQQHKKTATPESDGGRASPPGPLPPVLMSFRALSSRAYATRTCEEPAFLRSFAPASLTVLGVLKIFSTRSAFILCALRFSLRQIQKPQQPPLARQIVNAIQEPLQSLKVCLSFNSHQLARSFLPRIVASLRDQRRCLGRIPRENQPQTRCFD
jgi:hypothetical protein